MDIDQELLEEILFQEFKGVANALSNLSKYSAYQKAKANRNTIAHDVGSGAVHQALGMLTDPSKDKKQTRATEVPTDQLPVTQPLKQLGPASPDETSFTKTGDTVTYQKKPVALLPAPTSTKPPEKDVTPRGSLPASTAQTQKALPSPGKIGTSNVIGRKERYNAKNIEKYVNLYKPVVNTDKKNIVPDNTFIYVIDYLLRNSRILQNPTIVPLEPDEIIAELERKYSPSIQQAYGADITIFEAILNNIWQGIQQKAVIKRKETPDLTKPQLKKILLAIYNDGRLGVSKQEATRFFHQNPEKVPSKPASASQQAKEVPKPVDLPPLTQKRNMNDLLMQAKKAEEEGNIDVADSLRKAAEDLEESVKFTSYNKLYENWQTYIKG